MKKILPFLLAVFSAFPFSALSAPAASSRAPVRYSYLSGAGEGWSYAAKGERPRWEGFGDFAAFYGGNSFYECVLRGKFSGGLALAFPVLDDPARPEDPTQEHTFLGNLVKEKERRMNVYPFVEYTVCPFLRLALSYYRIAVSTYNQNNDRVGDGTASLKGLWFSAKCQWPLFDGRLLPYATLGVAVLDGNYAEAAWWHYGYSSPDDYRSHGSRRVLKNDHYRVMEVEDATAFVWGAGIAWRPFEHWEADFSVTFLDANADADFYYDYPASGKIEEVRHGYFAFDNHQFCIAAKYIF